MNSQKEPCNILIAGFDENNQQLIINLLEQIKLNNPEFNFYTQTADDYNNITAALNENLYKICFLNSEINSDEIQNQLNILNKHTALINICTSTNTSNSTSSTQSFINIQFLNSYWLFYIINQAINTANLQKEIKRLSHYDNLTGLVNRNLYLNHLNHALALSERSKRFCTLIYLDINNFRNINKKYGYKHGDMVLVECAQRIKKSIRSIDLAARLSSDEFAISLENCNQEEAKRIILDLKQAMTLPFDISIAKINIDCSIDNANYPDSCADMTLFLNNVRQAHYLAKTS